MSNLKGKVQKELNAMKDISSKYQKEMVKKHLKIKKILESDKLQDFEKRGLANLLSI